MLNRYSFLLLACAISITPLSHAQPAHESAKVEAAAINSFINDLAAKNGIYMSIRRIEFFSDLAKGQQPFATVVTCSDSRVQTNMFSRAPEGQLFMIRNIGNQLTTAEGSVEYGVHHLHSPVLMFVGHSRCGAIAAVSGNYSKESEAIRRELDTINISSNLNNMDGVHANVHNQVSAAMIKFGEEMRKGELVVIGAVMDFADDMHSGAGKLHIINVNGESDRKKLENVKALLSEKRLRLR
ncbi:MAG: carbonic anhydrase [Sideroxydans sp.]|nr:carbonic anhydrase [Sideroxydans sp.]